MIDPFFSVTVVAAVEEETLMSVSLLCAGQGNFYSNKGNC